jgi:hypothetical protein
MSGARTVAICTTRGVGWCTTLFSNPECATEQVEQAWSGALELSAWTWIAWTAPVKAINSMHNKHRNLTRLLECDVCPSSVKGNAPRPSIRQLVLRCTAGLPGCQPFFFKPSIQETLDDTVSGVGPAGNVARSPARLQTEPCCPTEVSIVRGW